MWMVAFRSGSAAKALLKAIRAQTTPTVLDLELINTCICYPSSLSDLASVR